MIHATRSFLLNDFVDPRRKSSCSHPLVTDHVQKCIEAAEDVMTLVDSLGKQGILIQSFWFTHYVCFCAIIVVYIHTIQQHHMSSQSLQKHSDPNRLRYLFNLAESCQQHLAQATRKNCPSRRYSIILEELRREVHRQIGSPFQTSPSLTMAHEQQPGNLFEQKHFPANADQPLPFDSNPAGFQPSYPPVSDNLQSGALPQDTFTPGDEAGLLENFEGLNWWAQLDSWVSCFPSAKSGLLFSHVSYDRRSRISIMSLRHLLYEGYLLCQIATLCKS